MSAQDTTDAENAAMLATLTPEELAAINDEDAIEQEALAAIANAASADEDGEDDDDASADADAKAKPEAKAKEPEADAAKAATDGAAADDAADSAPANVAKPPASAQPQYRADLPEDFEARKTSLKERTDELRSKFKAGDIELDEYEAQRETLADERMELDRLALKADISKDMQAQSAEQLWNAAINRQFEAAATPAGGGIDYQNDQDKLNDLDGFVKMLANNPANADKDSDWFMANAHKRVLALHDIKPVAAPAPAPSPAPAARKPPVAGIPANLSNVPGSDAPGDMGGEFDNLDAMEGVELEAAISRLTPAQREKYARGG